MQHEIRAVGTKKTNASCVARDAPAPDTKHHSPHVGDEVSQLRTRTGNSLQAASHRRDLGLDERRNPLLRRQPEEPVDERLRIEFRNQKPESPPDEL